MKVYILTRFCHYEQTGEHAIWSDAFGTRREAEKAMRKAVHDDVESYSEGCDIIEKWTDYLKIIRDAVSAGGVEHDAVIDWTSERYYIYDIFESEVKA